MKTESMKESLQGALAELETLRDEIRVNLHLAGMDLRDEWKSLEKRLPDRKAAERFKDATKEAVESLTREVREFKRRLHEKSSPHAP
jgi:hypothetical protein